MQTPLSTSLTWPKVLAGLRACAGESVLIRDGRETEPAAAVRPRPAAKGTELCLFPGEKTSREALVDILEMLAKAGGRRFMGSARANIGSSFLLIESVADEDVDGTIYAVVKTRRPALGYNQSQQTGSTTHLRSKRIKNK
jgi:hypothetical protein